MKNKLASNTHVEEYLFKEYQQDNNIDSILRVNLTQILSNYAEYRIEF